MPGARRDLLVQQARYAWVWLDRGGTYSSNKRGMLWFVLTREGSACQASEVCLDREGIYLSNKQGMLGFDLIEDGPAR
jgi:hypothetical protein